MIRGEEHELATSEDFAAGRDELRRSVESLRREIRTVTSLLCVMLGMMFPMTGAVICLALSLTL